MRLTPSIGYGTAIGIVMLCACAAPQSVVSQSSPSGPELNSPVVVDVRTLIMGRHPAAVAQAGEDLQRLGFTLVHRDRLQPILDEQDRHLNDPLATHAYLVRSGARSGAEVVVFVDVAGSPFSPSVIVQGIDVESGDILWSSAIVSTHPSSIEDYARLIIDLTHHAIMDGFTKPQGGSTAVLLSHP